MYSTELKKKFLILDKTHIRKPFHSYLIFTCKLENKSQLVKNLISITFLALLINILYNETFKVNISEEKYCQTLTSFYHY